MILSFNEWYDQRHAALTESCDPLILEGFLGGVWQRILAFFDLDHVPASWWDDLVTNTTFAVDPRYPFSVGDYFISPRIGNLYQISALDPEHEIELTRIKPVVSGNDVEPKLSNDKLKTTIAELVRSGYRHVPSVRTKEWWNEVIGSLKALAYKGPPSERLEAPWRGRRAKAEIEKMARRERDVARSIDLSDVKHGAYVVAGYKPGGSAKTKAAWKVVDPSVWANEAGDDVRSWLRSSSLKWKPDDAEAFVRDLRSALSRIGSRLRMIELDTDGEKPVMKLTGIARSWKDARTWSHEGTVDAERFAAEVRSRLGPYVPNPNTTAFTKQDFFAYAWK